MNLAALNEHLRPSRTGNWDHCGTHVYEPHMKNPIFNLKEYGLENKTTYTQAQRNWLKIEARRLAGNNPTTVKMITAKE